MKNRAKLWKIAIVAFVVVLGISAITYSLIAATTASSNASCDTPCLDAPCSDGPCCDAKISAEEKTDCQKKDSDKGCPYKKGLQAQCSQPFNL